ncbi:MAG: redox-regulated ATPase YchF [Patescibacteria group bacterium]|nr:MAG: redox-regulated ATPase YchF [Patescibacteria group bacterium]
MPLSIGIVGLPNVGKSTLFTALTKKQAEAANYPFCTIEPNVGLVAVPDHRLNELAKISQPKKIIPTAIEFVDIAGLVKGASQGEGLGNQFLSHIRECDAICQVIREFNDDNIIHVHNKVDPEADRETINLELILADLSTVTKRLDKVVREAKSGNKEALWAKELLERTKDHLEKEQSARDMNLNEEERLFIKQLGLITVKPLLYILNTNETKSGQSWDNVPVICIDAKLEAEIASLGEEEQTLYIQELGLKESGLDRLIRAGYDLLGLITFLTTGPEETRAWTVKKGSLAPEAAGVIHTDFIKGFIRAEVINWQDFVKAGSETTAKAQGLIRTEGKDYIIQDGDVCNFLVNT